MLKPVRVLLIEDEVITSMHLKVELAKIGCEVIKTFSRGEDAVEEIGSNGTDADLILMDINLAGNIDGLETARILKEKKDLSVIFISGYSDESIEERAHRLNPLAFITKPLNYRELKKIITDSF